MKTRELTTSEKKIFNALVEAAGDIVSHSEICEILYPSENHRETENYISLIRVYINSIRKKLSPGVIGTVRGKGFYIADLDFTHRYRTRSIQDDFIVFDHEVGGVGEAVLAIRIEEFKSEEYVINLVSALNFYNLRHLYGA